MIDELNKLEYEKENSVNIIPIQRYFREMELSEKQIKEREKFATDLKDMFMIFFLLFRGNKVAGNVQDIDYYNTMLNRQYKELLETYSLMSYLDDDMVNAYIPLMLASVINTTYEKQDEPYILSEERAEFLSTDQTNTVLNEADYNRAIKNGATEKLWITENDERVRKTHKEIDPKKLPIKSLFHVGQSLMRFPKDTKYGASLREIINCRCSIKYLNGDNSNDKNSLLNNKEIAQSSNNDIIEANNIPKSNGLKPLNLQYFAKKHKAKKVFRSDPLWDNLVMTYKDSLDIGEIITHEFGGYMYIIEYRGEYSFAILSKRKLKNIHE